MNVFLGSVIRGGMKLNGKVPGVTSRWCFHISSILSSLNDLSSDEDCF